MSWRSVVEKSCGEVLSRSVVEKCCREGKQCRQVHNDLIMTGPSQFNV